MLRDESDSMLFASRYVEILHLLPKSGDCWLCLKSSFETFQVAINPAVRKALFQAIVEKQLHSVFFHLWLFDKTHKSELG